MIPKKLAICVSFHFVEHRLKYLNTISDQFAELADEVVVHIITNTQNVIEQDKIRETVKDKGYEYDLFIPTGLGHPYLLTWSHLAVFKEQILDESYTHFLYVEDDILIKRSNIEYWVEGYSMLKKHNFIPSFLRVEKKKNDPIWYTSDCLQTYDANRLPQVQLQNGELMYVNIPTPYQGMYLLDRELMLEHLNGKSSIPEYGKFRGIRELAASGLTHSNVRERFYSRNLLPFSIAKNCIDEACFIHHLPNNYAVRDDSPNAYGSISVHEALGTIAANDLVSTA